MRSDLDDITGKKFGNWVVLELGQKTKKTTGATYWLCRCDGCGNEREVARKSLIRGISNSCGCKFGLRPYEFLYKNEGNLDVSPEILVKTLNYLSKLCRSDNDKWWRRPNGRKLTRNDGELFMLIVSEVAEAMEGVRKDLMDDHLPHRKMVVVELADVLIRVFDYCGEHNLDIGGALMEKRNYNTARKDHSYAARSKPNGKKW